MSIPVNGLQLRPFTAIDDDGRQSHRPEYIKEKLRVKLFHVVNTSLAPFAGQHHDRADHGRDAGSVADRL